MTLGLEFSWFFSQKYFHHNFAHLLLKPLDWSKVIGASTGDLESPNSRYTLRKIRKKALQRPWETLIFLHEDLTTFEKESITKIMTHIREAPFWNVLVLYGHCPNSFRPPPPLSNRHCGALILDPIFWNCQNELKGAQTIQASVLTPLPPP